jgi:hypothetical protein
MSRLLRITQTVSDYTIGTAIVIVHAALASRERAHARRRLELGLPDASPRVPRDRASLYQAP